MGNSRNLGPTLSPNSVCSLGPHELVYSELVLVTHGHAPSRVAEEKLDVPSLLDPEDMADCDEDEGPDKFSVVTYVSQFYHLFKDSDDSR